MSNILARLADLRLAKRDYYSNDGCGYGYYYSYGNYCRAGAFYSYGRWILLAVIVAAAFLIFLGFSCLQARRRRRAGRRPIAGTGWLAPAGHGPAQYNQQWPQQQQQQYAPPSGPPPGANADYYGGQEAGVTQPGQAYQNQRGGEPVYAPPQGPPPSKY